MSLAEVGVGDVIRQRFVLEEELGSGGMGRVFRALDRIRQEAQDREPYVAIKVLSESFRSQPLFFIALQREAKKAQRLNHPNIVRVYDFDKDGPHIFLVMECLSGQSLDAWIDRAGSLQLDQVLFIVKSVAAALEFAHNNGIVHLDLKPKNIFVTNDGHVKVIDFGIARAIRNPESPEDDRTIFDPRTLGALSPSYASPQMIDGLEPDARDDVFSLACVTYELLTGRHPFSRVPATRARAERREPLRPSKLNNRQWAGLKRGLSFDRDTRTPNVHAFVSDLTAGEQKTFRLPLLILAGVLGIGLIAGVGYWWWSRPEQQVTALPSLPAQQALPSQQVLPVEPPRDKPSAQSPMPKPAPLPPPVLPVAPPPPDAASLAPVIADLLSNVSCARLRTLVRGDALTIEGYAGNQRSLDQALETIKQKAAGIPISREKITLLDPIYCRPLEALQPFVQTTRNRDIELAVSGSNPEAPLHEGDDLVLSINTLAHSTYLYVDYFSLDGNVVHMLPNPTFKANRLTPSAPMTLGEGGTGRWTIGEPFGTELISVLTSPKPLFTKLRPEVEPAEAYLADLREALARIGKSSTPPILAELAFIKTEPGR